MQQPCYRCGAPVDDGTRFCRQCNAPQIKVVPAEPPAMEDVIETHPELAHRPSEAQPPPRSRPIDWRSAFPAIFFVAVPAGLLSFPLNLLFFVWTFGAGALSVSSYRKRTQVPVTPGMAARLGLLSGVVAFAVFLLVFLIAMSRPDFGPPLREQLRVQIEQKIANNPDPNVRKAAAVFTSPNGFATVFTVAIAMLGILYLLFSVLGAVAGATVFAPKNRAP
jgi:hypothetical protein